MAGKRSNGRKAIKPKTPVHVEAHAVKFEDFVGGLARAIASELRAGEASAGQNYVTQQNQNKPGSQLTPAQSQGKPLAAPAPPTDSSVENANRNFALATALACRLLMLEDRLRGNPENGSNQTTPTPSGLNSVLEHTSDALTAAHDSVSRLCSYLGVEV